MEILRASMLTSTRISILIRKTTENYSSEKKIYSKRILAWNISEM
jgi:hypothetical protein